MSPFPERALPLIMVSALMSGCGPEVVDGESFSVHDAIEGASCSYDDVSEALTVTDEAVVMQCLPSSLPLQADGGVNCIVIQAFAADGASCDELDRADIPPERAELRDRILADPYGDPSRSLLCEVPRLSGDDELACLRDEVSDGNGYCVLSGGPEPIGDEDLVAACEPDRRRVVKLSGDAVSSDAKLYFFCDAVTAPCR